MRLSAFILFLFLFSGFWQAAAAPESKPIHLLFIGDSITDGYGLKRVEAYPALIERKLQSQGRVVKVINAAISGSVTAESDRRLQWQLRGSPDILILALGGNDALKGTPVAQMKKNLAATIDLALKKHIKVLLVGIQVFRNFGDAYNKQLKEMYASLAREKKIPLVPFILEGVGTDKALMQADGKHPTAKGQEKIAELVLKSLEPLL